MIRSMLILAAALSMLSCGYGGDSNTCEDVQACLSDFLAGAEHDLCMDNAPICQTAAGCGLREDEYIQGHFPGYINFIVNTSADATIVVKIFFDNQGHPGEDTVIVWYEPGCHESYRYESMGADVFAVAGQDRVFEQEQTVLEEGAHLVEIYSDATTDYYLRVELK